MSTRKNEPESQRSDQSRELEETFAKQIWDDYFPRLAKLARKKLGDLPRRALDEEDIALSAMNSFFAGVDEGRIDPNGRGDLWQLLATITARKAIQYFRHSTAEKRGGGNVRGESVFEQVTDCSAASINQVHDRNEMPEFSEQIIATCDDLLTKLKNEKLRSTALLRMEGFSNMEISDQLGCSLARTKQRLARIKEIWSDSLDPK